jgi:hypothetical protein
MSGKFASFPKRRRHSEIAGNPHRTEGVKKLAIKSPVTIRMKGAETVDQRPLKPETLDRITRGMNVITTGLYDYQRRVIDEIVRTPRR